MRIIRSGDVNPVSYRGLCLRCNCVFECVPSEVRSYLFVGRIKRCPECRAVARMEPQYPEPKRPAIIPPTGGSGTAKPFCAAVK